MTAIKDTSPEATLVESVSRGFSETEGIADNLETRELRSRFNVFAAIGIQFSISATPLTIGSYLVFILGAGGSPFFFYAFLVAATGQLLVCTCLSEIASVFPHASGQVFWTAALAPPKWARFLSYWAGATTTLGWMFANAGSPIFTGILLGAALEVQYPNYVAQEYHIFLMSLACSVVGVILNIWLFNYYPHVTRFMIVFINLSTVYILVVLLVRANPKASAHTVFLDVINETGWDSDALVFFLCFLPGCVAIACFDAGAHMSEEMDAPERQVPLVMMGGSAMCACTAVPMILVYLFCTVKPENLLTPAGGQPIFQLFIDSFNSSALLTIALIIYVIVYLGSCPATLATGSRLVWSFAKHGGLPFPQWVGYVDPKSQIPVNAVYLTTVVGILISLLLFGPSTILNGIFGAAAVCFLFSYGLPIWLNVATWGRQLPPNRYFNLGRFSMIVSIVAIIWQFVSVTFLCFPIYRPVTLTNMNWASVCAVVGFAIFGLNWVFYSRKYYRTPKALYVEGLHGRK